MFLSLTDQTDKKKKKFEKHSIDSYFGSSGSEDAKSRCL